MTNVEEEVDPDKVNVVEAWGYNYKKQGSNSFIKFYQIFTF